MAKAADTETSSVAHVPLKASVTPTWASRVKRPSSPPSPLPAPTGASHSPPVAPAQPLRVRACTTGTEVSTLMEPSAQPLRFPAASRTTTDTGRSTPSPPSSATSNSVSSGSQDPLTHPAALLTFIS